MRLSDYAVGRDNNFTLLRFSAAMTVLFAHSVAVLGLPPEREFFFNRLGFSLGEMGLDMLFVTSGFLVTASLLGRQDLIAYLWARILRVYPGLWVMLVLTVFVLAPALTTLPRGDYYTSPLTWEYFRKCATLIGGVRYSLPGVFENVPLKGEFNGSLWTMPVEVRMYLYLAAIWVALAVMPAAAAQGHARRSADLGWSAARDRVQRPVDRRRVQRREHSRLHVPLRIKPLPVARSDADGSLAARRDSRGACVRLVRQDGLFRRLRGVPRSARPSSGLRARRADPVVQRLGRLFLRGLYLRFPGSADIGLSLPSHVARRDDGFVRGRLGRDRDRVMEADRGARARIKGDFAEATSRAFNLGLAKIVSVVR